MSHPIFKSRPLTRFFWTALFLLGIYLGTHPQLSPETTPGYRFLMRLVPSQYLLPSERAANGNREVFWLMVGGPVIIFALEHAPFLQRIFTTRFAQYLGDISFSIYMLHFTIMCTLGHWLVPRCMDLTGGWANGQFGFV
jgi:hypothetical protein